MRRTNLWRHIAVVCLTRGCPAIAIAIALAMASVARAADPGTAHVTHLTKPVEIDSGSGKPHAASQSEAIKSAASLRTGTDAALELTFDDGSFARLGRNTDLRMQSESHFSLHRGAMLLHVPRS